MDELTIEQKANAYDWAFGRAKGLYAKGAPDSLHLEEMFPELKESEDELKWLTQFIQEEAYSLSIDIRDNEDRIKLEKLRKALAWLEKQREKANPYSGVSFEYNGHTWGMCARDYGVEILVDGEIKERVFLDKPQGKTAFETINEVKVEPKFRNGQWIVWRDKCYKVVYNGCGYELVDQNGLRTSLEYGTIDENAHLWAIQDAKDGDVLFQDLMGGKTFIFNGINPEMAILYSFIINNDGEDVLPYHIGKSNTGIGYIEDNKNIIYPATKEQRDLLFAKMEEEGYAWYSEYKELKKIEQKPSEWSEEDESMLKTIFGSLETYAKTAHPCLKSVVEKEVDWLKSLKNRVPKN